MKNQPLSQKDQEINSLVEKEIKRQEEEIELIASENYTSKAVIDALGTPLGNKYSEGYPGKRYYGGNQVIDEIETLAIERAKKLFQAEHANVQPLSGSPANAAVYFAFLKPGDKVMGLKLDHGGHLSHGHPVNFSGMLYNFVQYGVSDQNGYIDMDEVEKIALEEKPKMLVAGFSAYSREVEWERFKEIADKIGAFTFADIAHTAGLIAAGELKNPVPIFDVTSTTTHKTLRGPRGALIMCKEKFAKQIDRAVFPGMQGGPHNSMTAAKAVAFGEALDDSFKDYAKQVIANAKRMGEEFMNMGYKVISNGTDNHLIVVDITSKGISGKEAEKALEKVGISISRSTIPNDPNPPMNPSGIRLGSQAITSRGMKEDDIAKVSELTNKAMENSSDENILNEIKNEIREMCMKFPIY